MGLTKQEAGEVNAAGRATVSIGNIGKDEEEAVAVGFELEDHSKKSLGKLEINGGEVSLALTNC